MAGASAFVAVVPVAEELAAAVASDLVEDPRPESGDEDSSAGVVAGDDGDTRRARVAPDCAIRHKGSESVNPKAAMIEVL